MSGTMAPKGSFAAMYTASRNMSLDASPRQLRLEQLEPHADQPRQTFDAAALEELAASIRIHGVLQPLVVRPHPAGGQGRHQIVAGERRFHAARLAGLDAVPVVIRDLGDAEVREVALIENLQREDITPLEEARVLRQILDEAGLSHREIGDRIGKTKAYVEQRVRLLRYPEDVREALVAQGGTFQPGHAKAVVQITDPVVRQALVAKIASEGLSVREAERRTHQALQAKSTPTKRAAAPETVDLRETAVMALLQSVQASGQYAIAVEAFKQALKADLAAL